MFCQNLYVQIVKLAELLNNLAILQKCIKKALQLTSDWKNKRKKKRPDADQNVSF
ncbi:MULTISPECIES: hypothetical protein [unclassified Mesobacillus]|uniref:hypothetical protein n=1 Tax=unclassified Mesobacillus TaxID=2675270 RepID=UPI00203B57A3|nr:MULTISPECIES: hypothetical protein [unclassified Mesobacillus]MCM3124112.1 hypothetical protein [Mesobacillus sp. MER 33]MCM3233961.1 hypothetical protein [Mesobacillus sp. MER 48]